MDDDPRKRSIKELGFQSWLTNVFWAYYKWYFFVGVFALTFLVLTVITYARQDRADLVLTYVYSTAPDEAQMETVRSAFGAKAKPEGGRGTVKVKVEAIPLQNEKGERLLFGELEDSERMIYVLDGKSVSFFQNLGYFDLSWGTVPGTELTAALTLRTRAIPRSRSTIPTPIWSGTMLSRSRRLKSCCQPWWEIERLKTAGKPAGRMLPAGFLRFFCKKVLTLTRR